VTAALLDLIPGAPSFGNIFITIYLYFLSQTLARYRLLDLNELLGRMVVLATLVMIATVIYGLLLVKWVELDELGCSFSMLWWHRPRSLSCSSLCARAWSAW